MKRFISLFLVFSVLALSMPLTAKERKGADLIIQRTDGTQVRGELIAVKENSLLLLVREWGADVTINIDDIRVITILRKSKAWLGYGLGLLAGVGVGAIAGNQLSIPWWGKATGICAIIGGLAGALVGALLGSSAGKDKTFSIYAMSDTQIQEILKKLRKQARVRNAQ